jgi:hypothetical protein
MSRKSAHPNDVIIVVNSDGSITATFLGYALLKNQPTPIPKALAQRIVKSLSDDDERADLCYKRGLFQSFADEAVRNGAAQRFEEQLQTFVKQSNQRPIPGAPFTKTLVTNKICIGDFKKMQAGREDVGIVMFEDTPQSMLD